MMSSDTPLSRYQILGRCCLQATIQMTCLNTILRNEILLEQASCILSQTQGSLAIMRDVRLGPSRSDS